MMHKLTKTASVISLMAAGTFWKLLLAALAAAILQTAYMFIRLSQHTDYTGTMDNVNVLDNDVTRYTFVALILFSTLVLRLNLRNIKSRCIYTLKRTMFSEKSLFFLQAGFNAACFLILYFLQLLTMLLLCGIYMKMRNFEHGIEILQLSFFHRGFLHWLLPLGDIFGMLRTIMLTLALAVTSASVPVFFRRGKNNVTDLLIGGAIMNTIVSNYGFDYVDVVFASAALLVIIIILPLTLREVKKDA